VSVAAGANIEALSLERAHRTLTVKRQGGKLQRLNSWGLGQPLRWGLWSTRGYLAGSGSGSRGWNATLCDVGIEARRADHYEDLRLRAACDGEAVLGIAWQEHESPR
jgi:hypothetical protein